MRLAGRLKKTFGSATTRRSLVSLTTFVVLWELSARLKIPVLGAVPSPAETAACLVQEIFRAEYWRSWGGSLARILIGFAAAQLLGVPLGLFLGWSRRAREVIFPLVEIMRPVPPLAWVPVSVIFWPSAELSMIFVTFLGAFFTVILNIVEGIAAVDERYLRAAASLGAGKSGLFWHVLLPASLPSVLTGMTVGMGITWCVVVAAEMIATDTGLGFLTWRGYVAGEFPLIVVGMLSIGLAGWLSSGLIRRVGLHFAPWLKN
ncbi:MAG: ABC transporter permease [Deltaproteobacteria bacterium]|jgi:NitT/TauT family transport system permease protein|nr:ABC transporter permease [Deltaproteobacteria bacterium]